MTQYTFKIKSAIPVQAYLPNGDRQVSQGDFWLTLGWFLDANGG